MSRRILSVCLEDRLVLCSQDIFDGGLRPLDEWHIHLLRVGDAVIYSVLCEENDMGPRQDCGHVLFVFDGGEGRSDDVEETLMRNAAGPFLLHLLEKLFLDHIIVRIVASVTSSSLIKLSRWIASPHSRILFLSSCKREDRRQTGQLATCYPGSYHMQLTLFC